ncbi:signal recognition particle-docking protein FtsY [Taylorella equigenitalis]|uniref:signal recognition particle-docking protein FtsY n=1 Tax=Taylorella equigenitalis TaxID=29575 RepID=UPI00040CC419|nr:signal recognition particle-docking protein FtsY [Taylorella equigenitalis]WDU46709.1 signal recognition particle-docking protein FtsY [Taylorella equigenitalis]
MFRFFKRKKKEEPVVEEKIEADVDEQSQEQVIADAGHERGEHESHGHENQTYDPSHDIRETQEPAEAITSPDSSFDSLWPTPDANGKVRIKISLSDALPPISEEELEKAALAEVREDDLSRFGYVDSDDESVEFEEEQVQGRSAQEAGVKPDHKPKADHEIEPELLEPDLREPEPTDPSEPSELTELTELTEPSESSEPEVEHKTLSPSEKKGWFSRLKKGLSRSNIGTIFVGTRIDEELFEELENSLLMADAGVIATQKIISELRQAVKKQHLEDVDQVKHALTQIIAQHLKPLEKIFDIHEDRTNVVMIAGVNGAGKTTSIGKLAYHFQAHGASLLLAAGDTFRAAAREQLQQWGLKNNVQVISQQGGDPASVAFDAVNSGIAKKTTVVMIDTAGRLPTQTHLMEELKKIKRVITKAESSAPHEVLLVVDGNTGQNALAQIKAFDEAIGLTGLLVTKLDGTAKGGVLVAMASGVQGVRTVPVYWIGVGESLEDLQPFVAEEFAQALVG